MLKDVEGISSTVANKLSKAGIQTVGDLVNAGSKPNGLKNIFRKNGYT
jgi:isopentenyl diphosphate isomerase/L-lactate dehydrogenase-like FMN-dependent dehydrogenase